MWAILLSVLIVVLAKELGVLLVHALCTCHPVDVDTGETGGTHILPRCLPIVEDLLSLAVRRELVALGLRSSWLTLRPTEYLPVEIHLYSRIALQLTENVLDIVHDVREVDEVVAVRLPLRLLLLWLLRRLLLSVHSLTPAITCRAPWLLWHLPHKVLYVLQIIEPRDPLHSSQELLEVLSVCWHLLPITVISVLLLIWVLAGSVSVLVMGHPRRVSPPLVLPHVLLMALPGELLLVLSLAAPTKLLLLLRQQLLLPSVHVLLVARVRLYIVELLVDQIELRAVVVDIVLVVDALLAVVYYLFLNQISALARQIILAHHVRAGGLPWQYGPHPTPRLLYILVLIINSELLVNDIFVLTVFVVVAVIIIFILGVILVTIVVVLGHILLSRSFVILVHDSDLVAVVAIVSVQGVLPGARAVVVFLGGDVDLVRVVLMVVVPSLPASTVVMARFGSDAGLPDQYILLGEHVIQVLRLLPHGRRGDRRALVRVAAPVDLTGSGTLLVLPLGVAAVMPPVTAVSSMSVPSSSRAHLLSTRVTRLPRLLLAIMELIADSEVIFADVDHLLKSVVVPVHFHRVRDDRLDSIVVAHHFHGADHTEEGHVLTPGRLREHLVVVASDYQRRDSITSSDLNRAIVASEYHAIAGLHDRHRNTVV